MNMSASASNVQPGNITGRPTGHTQTVLPVRSQRQIAFVSGGVVTLTAMQICARTLCSSLIVSLFLVNPAMAQPTNRPAWQRWLDAAPAIPDFQPSPTLGEWQKKREQVRADLWRLLGRLPPRPAPPTMHTISRDDRGDFSIEKFQFDNGAGDMVPGYLLLPKRSSEKLPAVLYCHWHGGQYDVGKEELFRTNATPVPAGPAFAKLGFVVMAVDACCFGERNGRGAGGQTDKGGAGEMTASKFNLWLGRTLWGMMLRDDLIALDCLCSRPEVDTNRIGVTGISMGATRTWWLMALDDRLKAGVAVCCLTRYQNLIASESLREHGIYYFVPGILNHFDIEAVVAMAAPRPLLFQSGEKDSGSPVDGIRVIESKVRRLYQLHGAEANFRSIIYPGVGHVYTREMWQKTTEWLATHLSRS